MSDVYCSKCGEPWDYYGVKHGDMLPHERDKFLRGEGCPSCGFGKFCPLCGGTGKDGGSGLTRRCETCSLFRPGWVMCWSPQQTVHNARGVWKVEHFYAAGSNRIIAGPSDERAEWAKKHETEPMVQTADGWITQWWVPCPDCDPSELTACSRCSGTGKVVSLNEDSEMEALKSEIDASDEDPILIIHRRMR